MVSLRDGRHQRAFGGMVALCEVKVATKLAWPNRLSPGKDHASCVSLGRSVWPWLWSAC